MKSGQVEMIGLVIVVVLLVLGALFYAGLALGRNPVKKEATLEVAYINNLLNAMLNVKVCDETWQFSDEIVACFNGEDLCGENSCEFLKSEIDKVMAAVGLKGLRTYYLWIESENEKKVILGEECKSGSKADIKISGRNDRVYEVNLKLC